MQLTPKLNLKKPDLTDSINVQDLNDNMDVLDTAVSELQEGSASIPDLETNDKTLAGAINEIKQTVNDVETNAQQQLKNHEADYVKHPGVGINGLDGSANKLTLTLAVAPPSYQDNMGVLITPQTNTTAAATLNVNNLGYKSILKANGNSVTNLKAGVIYTLRYSSNKGAFILQGEGGTGNAQPNEVLTGKTFTNDNGDATGTMPDKTGTVIVPTTNDLVIPEGYYKNAKVQGVFIVPLEAPKYDGSTTFSVFHNPYFGGTTSTTYFPMTRKTWLGGSGIIEISFSMYSYGSAGLIKARIYINGQPRGIERSLNSTNSQTFTENFNINKGDFIEWMLMKVDSAPLSANMVSERIQIKGFTMVS